MKNLAYAFRPIANDMASSLFLILLLALHVDTMTATLASMAFGVAHIVFMRMTGRTVAPLQWASLGLVLVFGGAGLVFNDIRFLMAKPTIVYLIISAVMLKRGWMVRYLPPIAAGRGEGMMITWGYVWAGVMALVAVSNLIVAIWFAPFWAAFKAIVPTTLMLVLFAIQYASMRFTIRRQMIAAAQAQGQAQAA